VARVKCKECKRFIEGICIIFKRGRSTGRKRDCGWYDAKPPRQRVYAPYWGVKSRKERMKEQFIQQQETAKAKEMAAILEQQKQKDTVVKPILAIKENKKPSALKRMFQKIIPSR